MSSKNQDNLNHMKNKNYKKDMENAFEKGEMSDMLNNLKDGDYKNYIQAKYDIILKAFNKIDKNNDNMISYNELVEFLDNNMTSGKKFDKETAQKIMNLLDSTRDGYVSVNEFAKVFIQIEEELKMYLIQTKIKYESECSAESKFKNLALQYKNERMIDGEISESAKLKVDIINAVFKVNRNNDKNIFINVIFGNIIQKTNELPEYSDLAWNQTFEFQVTDLDDPLFIEICSVDGSNKSEIIGKVKLELYKFSNQDEFELDIGIPDDHDNEKEIAFLNTKIQFIRSFKKYYDDLAITTEANKLSLEKSLKETQRLFENLNEPFGFFGQLNNSSEFKKFSNSNIINYNLMQEKKASSKSLDMKIPEVENLDAPPSRLDVYHDQLTGKLENLLQNRFNNPNIKWMGLVKIEILVILCLSFFNLLARAEFITIGVVVYIIIIYLTSFISNPKKHLKDFVILLEIITLYDLVWLILTGGSFLTDGNFDGGAEDSLRGFVLFTSILGLISKVTLTLTFLMLRSKKNENLL